MPSLRERSAGIHSTRQGKTMNVKEAYGKWAGQYDTNNNRTRDMEAEALKRMLQGRRFGHCLEIGCGTGKNTPWLAAHAARVTAVDFSGEMLALAKEKVVAAHVDFILADINQPWDFATGPYELLTFSLVLEHIRDLEAIFRQAAACTLPGGALYLGELHPFKQYSGSGARFETEAGIQPVTCFTHHVSDFVTSAHAHGFRIRDLREFFDEDGPEAIPRILALVFEKTTNPHKENHHEQQHDSVKD